MADNSEGSKQIDNEMPSFFTEAIWDMDINQLSESGNALMMGWPDSNQSSFGVEIMTKCRLHTLYNADQFVGSGLDCRCGKHVSRPDALKRHLARHLPTAKKWKYPLPDCSEAGKRGFSRRDHLRQHVKTHHRLTNIGNMPTASNASRENEIEG